MQQMTLLKQWTIEISSDAVNAKATAGLVAPLNEAGTPPV